jgi:hypothetical protein
MAQIARNLSVTSSNLNQLGLWRLLWKPRAAPASPPPGESRVRSPNDPFH